jgi:hypothetical protein
MKDVNFEIFSLLSSILVPIDRVRLESCHEHQDIHALSIPATGHTYRTRTA